MKRNEYKAVPIIDNALPSQNLEEIEALQEILNTCASILDGYDEADHVIHCAMFIAEDVVNLFNRLADIGVTLTAREMSDTEVIDFYVNENAQLHKELSDVRQELGRLRQ